MPTFSEDGSISKKRKHEERVINERFDLIAEIQKAYATKSVSDRKGRMSPTGGAGFCELRAVRVATEIVEEEQTACNVYWFKMGQLSEDIYTEGVNITEKYIANDVRLTEFEGGAETLQLGGYIDIIVKDNNDKLLLIEKKTCGKFLPKRPKPMHENQIKLYMSWYALDGLVGYQSRDVGSFYGDLKAVQFNYAFDLEESKRRMSRVFYSRLCIDNKLLPYKPLDITKKADCGFCPFKGTCWDGEETESTFKNPTSDKEIDLWEKAWKLSEEFFTKENINIRRTDLLDKINIKRVKNFGLDEITKEEFESMLY